MSAVHRDVPVAVRGRRPLRVRVRRRPQLGAGAEHGHGRPVVGGLPGDGDGVRRAPGRHVHGGAAQGGRQHRAVRHVPVRLPPVLRGRGAHRRVRGGRGPAAAAGRRRGPQAVQDVRARDGRRQPHVLPAARRERGLVVGRRRPVPPGILPAGVHGSRLPGPGARGPRLRRVPLRPEEQLRRLRAQRHRVHGRLHHYRAGVRSAAAEKDTNAVIGDAVEYIPGRS